MGGFREHIAIDGSSNGVSGRDAACGCAVVQLFYRKEEDPLYAIHDTILAELDVQRKINRADLLALTMARSDWPTTIHADNMGIIDGLWRGEEGCIGLK